MLEALVICGPTASGKTDFGHYLAQRHAGEIVNSDSMQVYRQIPLITCSPTANLKAELPYHLYNFLDIDQEFSAAKFVKLAAEVIRSISRRGNLPIIVGGSGMYLSALLYGYSCVPAIQPQIRRQVQDLQLSLGQVEFFRRLIALDPLAQRLNILDSQRSMRAYEVFYQTNQSLFVFHAAPAIKPLAEYNFRIIYLKPQRHFLYLSCNQRLQAMLSRAAIDEVSAVKNHYPLLKTSAMRAIGLPEISSYLDKSITFDQVIKLSQNKTRQYAKRQVTWFEHQLPDKLTLPYSNCQEFQQLRQNFIIDG